MSANTLARVRETLPSIFDDFFKPWNEWFNGDVETRMMTVPAVNITEEKDHYAVSLAVPGLNKEDLSVDIDGNMITISARKRRKKKKRTRNIPERNTTILRSPGASPSPSM